MKKVALSLIALTMISAAASAAPNNALPPGLSGTGGLPPGFVHALDLHFGNLPPGLVLALEIHLAQCEQRTGSPCEVPVSP